MVLAVEKSFRSEAWPPFRSFRPHFEQVWCSDSWPTCDMTALRKTTKHQPIEQQGPGSEKLQPRHSKKHRLHTRTGLSGSMAVGLRLPVYGI